MLSAVIECQLWTSVWYMNYFAVAKFIVNRTAKVSLSLPVQ